MQDDGESEVQAGMNARGDTFQVLLISEWGKIACTDPIRSQEILTGAMPAAKRGIRFIETTWKGAKQGHLWNIMKRAMETKPGGHDRGGFHLVLFSRGGGIRTTAWRGTWGRSADDCAKYLGETEAEIGRRRGEHFEFHARAEAVVFQGGAGRRDCFGMRSIRVCLEECFKAPIEGAIYADLLDRLRTTGRSRPGAVDRTLLVHTGWDLGSPINTVSWYFQIMGSEIRVIDLDHELDLTPAERVARILGKGYLLGWHYLPHDALGTQKSGRTFQMELAALGIKTTRVVPRTLDIWVGINHLRWILPRFSFRLPECDWAWTCWGRITPSGRRPAGRRWTCRCTIFELHYADGLRTLAEAEMAGMIVNAGMGRSAGKGTTVRTGFRGEEEEGKPKGILDRFFGKAQGSVRVIR